MADTHDDGDTVNHTAVSTLAGLKADLAALEKAISDAVAAGCSAAVTQPATELLTCRGTEKRLRGLLTVCKARFP